MKLARKLTLLLVIGIFVVMAVNAYVRLARETTFFETDRREDERLMGRVLGAAVAAVWQTEGEARAQALVQRANDSVSEVTIRWVWLDGSEAPYRPVVPVSLIQRAWDGRSIVRPSRHAVNDDNRYAYVPLAIASDRRAALEISESLTREQRYFRSSVAQSVIAAIVTAAVCGLIAMGGSTLLVGGPIRRLCEQARRVGAGDLSRRVQVEQRDEIGELAREIDSMCDRLSEANERVSAETEARIAALEQLRHADRLKTVGQLASGVAHELGTPLNVILGRARMLSGGGLSDDELASSTSAIADEAERMSTIIRQLLDFARRRGPRLGARDLNEIAAQTVDMLSPIAEKRGVAVHLAAAPTPVVAHVDENQMVQALANLVVNGIQAMGAGGVLDVDVTRREVQPPPEHGGPAADYACIIVRDRGHGISDAHIPHIFEPFFTTKGVGEGTGLGLSVSYGIVREHGGWIEVESRVGEGTRFAIFLRAVAADGAAEAVAT